MAIAGFAMGFVGLIPVGVFVKGDTRQTSGVSSDRFFFDRLEFLFSIIMPKVAMVFQPEIENGDSNCPNTLSAASFGLWMMVMMMYVFSTNGCDFIT